MRTPIVGFGFWFFWCGSKRMQQRIHLQWTPTTNHILLPFYATRTLDTMGSSPTMRIPLRLNMPSLAMMIMMILLVRQFDAFPISSVVYSTSKHSPSADQHHHSYPFRLHAAAGASSRPSPRRTSSSSTTKKTKNFSKRKGSVVGSSRTGSTASGQKRKKNRSRR